MSPLSRRQFLGSSLKAGAGAVALGAGGLGTGVLLGGEASAASAATPSTVIVPKVAARSRLRAAVPVNVQSFVSRPDIHCVGVTTARMRPQPGQPPYIFMAPRMAAFGPGLPAGADRGLMICDLDGNLVWWRRMKSKGYDPFNFQVQTYNGQRVLTFYQGVVTGGFSIAGSYVMFNSNYVESANFSAVNYPSDLHEFVITPQNTALCTAYEKRNGLIVGHAQEIDIASKQLMFDWASYPAVQPSESFTDSGATGDYFHINSVAQWPGSSGDLLVSGRGTSAIYRVSRATGKIVWRLGGKMSNFDIHPGALFELQHDVRPLADGSGISLFDDAGGPERQSWGKVLNVSTRVTNSVTLRHEYNHLASHLAAPNQGNNQLLPTGGHFVGWGNSPYFTEFGPSGATVVPPTILEGRLPVGTTSYRSFMFEWAGFPPLEQLALVVHAGSGNGHFSAFASWNGATEVAFWQLLAGRSANSLTSMAIVPKHGFETVIPVSFSGATAFAVRAISRTGAVLGTSQVAGVS